MAGRKSGQPTRADKERELRRRQSKRDGEKKKPIASDHHRAAQLAQALRIYKNPEHAARWLGIASEDVDRIMSIVLSEHGEASAASAADRLEVAASVLAEEVMVNRHEIAPRDLGHVVNALANARRTLMEKAQANYSEVAVSIGD